MYLSTTNHFIKMNNPDLYCKYNGLTRSSAIRCLNEYAPKIKWVKEGGRIIDLGCADGNVTKIMRKYIPENYETFISCDINEKMIQYAKKNCANEKITFRVQNVEGDLADDLKAGFDQVFSFFLFHWIRDQEKAFRNIYNLLKDGGDCLVTVLKYVPIYEMFERVARDKKWGKSWLSDLGKLISPYYYIEEPEKVIKEILENIGFVNIEIKRKQWTYVYENGTELKHVIRSVEPYDMPQEVYEDFLKDSLTIAQDMNLLDKTAKSYDDHVRPVDYNYILFVIYANKPRL